MIDKVVPHLPLYRQHQRLTDSGITLNRATLINYIQQAIELITPIYQAQLEHILQSKVLTMDEVSIKAALRFHMSEWRSIAAAAFRACDMSSSY